jgi:hypothetical protein
MSFKKLAIKLKDATIEMGKIVLSKRGFLSWCLANVIVSSVWFIPMALGFVFNQPEWLAFGSGLFVLMWLPPPIESFAVAFLTIFFYKKVIK